MKFKFNIIGKDKDKLLEKLIQIKFVCIGWIIIIYKYLIIEISFIGGVVHCQILKIL